MRARFYLRLTTVTLLACTPQGTLSLPASGTSHTGTLRVPASYESYTRAGLEEHLGRVEPLKMTIPEFGPRLAVQVAAHSVRGGRKVNADFSKVARIGPSLVVMVADGVGDHELAREASRDAVEGLERLLRQEPGFERVLKEFQGESDLVQKQKASEIGDFLQTQFREMNRQIIRSNPMPTKEKDSVKQTTLLVAVILPEALFVARIGDSRPYLRGEKLWLLTRDQKSTWNENQMRELMAQGIQQEDLNLAAARLLHHRKSMIEGYLGVGGAPLPASVEWEYLRRGDRVVLMTDGVYDQFQRHEEMEAILNQNLSADELRRQLLGRRRKGDNRTVVVVEVQGVRSQRLAGLEEFGLGVPELERQMREDPTSNAWHAAFFKAMPEDHNFYWWFASALGFIRKNPEVVTRDFLEGLAETISNPRFTRFHRHAAFWLLETLASDRLEPPPLGRILPQYEVLMSEARLRLTSKNDPEDQAVIREILGEDGIEVLKLVLALRQGKVAATYQATLRMPGLLEPQERAVKLIYPILTGSPEYPSRFFGAFAELDTEDVEKGLAQRVEVERKAGLWMARLDFWRKKPLAYQHPILPPVSYATMPRAWDVGMVQQRPYVIVEEWVPGIDLQFYLDGQEPRVEEATQAAIAAYRNIWKNADGIVPTDIKPANVVVFQDGKELKAKVVDLPEFVPADEAKLNRLLEVLSGLEEAPKVLDGEAASDFALQEVAVNPAMLAAQRYVVRGEVQHALDAGGGMLRLSPEITAQLSGVRNAVAGVLTRADSGLRRAPSGLILFDSDLRNGELDRLADLGLINLIKPGSRAQDILDAMPALQMRRGDLAVFQSDEEVTSQLSRLHERVTATLGRSSDLPLSVVGSGEEVSALPGVVFRDLAEDDELPRVVSLGLRLKFRDQFNQEYSLIVFTQV